MMFCRFVVMPLELQVSASPTIGWFLCALAYADA